MSGPLRLLSLGAGVQSSTVLLLSCLGELPKLDGAIFADTGWEPPQVYRHLDWLEEEAHRHGIPVYRVAAGNLRRDILRSKAIMENGEAGRRASIPAYTREADGSRGILPRQCTRDYKLRPIHRKAKALAGGGRLPRGAVEQWIGISLDEASRMKDSRVAWATNRYPLIFDVPMTRADCLLWLDRHGYPRPPRSSCIGCPYHSDREWRAIRDDQAAWEDAVAFDRELRVQRGLRGQAYLHRSLIPLDQVDLATAEEKGQLNLFENECEGMCGV